MKFLRSAWFIAAIMVIGITQISAQAPNSGPDLTGLNLEDLMNLEVTSVSKKEEKLFQSAAAIYVITREEIRRSGLTSLPELLRLSPGLQVARIDGNKWAISSRGFNGRFANKLLILIDGRCVYSPETSGVYWEAQHLPVEEIERIEVIRGPGGTLWGANAVNGVINVITKNAKDTQGRLVTAGGGTEEQGFGSLQYGRRIGANAYYRVYARYFNRGSQVNADGFNVHDWQNWMSGGFRLDWRSSKRDTWTLHGDLYDSPLRETSIASLPGAPFTSPHNTPAEFTGGNVLGRWHHTFSDRSDTTLQLYFDRSHRESYDLGERFDTFDIDLQHHLALGQRQEIVCGLGYRLIADRNNGNGGTPVQYVPQAQTVQIFSGFVQDEFTLVKNQLRLTLGSKLEHNDYTGYETQPNARLLWTPSPNQTVWAAISRAVRTPARASDGIRVNLPASQGPGGLPIIPALIGNPNFRSEELRAYEAGYRIQSNRRFSLDIAAFYNFYDRLQTFQPGQPFPEFTPQPTRLVIPLGFENLGRGETYGAEVSANWNLVNRWQLHGSYSFLRMQLHSYPESRDLMFETYDGENPRHQFQIQSRFNLPRNLELDSGLYHVSSLSSINIPRYTRLDLRFGWRAKEYLELSLGAQNLLDDHHPEFNGHDTVAIMSQARRSVYAKASWRF